jgi:hypothetical protein
VSSDARVCSCCARVAVTSADQRSLQAISQRVTYEEVLAALANDDIPCYPPSRSAKRSLTSKPISPEGREHVALLILSRMGHSSSMRTNSGSVASVTDAPSDRLQRRTDGTSRRAA